MPKKVSWKWGGKKYTGTVIKNTDSATYARTHNGKVKVIVKSHTRNGKLVKAHSRKNTAPTGYKRHFSASDSSFVKEEQSVLRKSKIPHKKIGNSIFIKK